MNFFLMYLYQLPQNLLALAIILWHKYILNKKLSEMIVHLENPVKVVVIPQSKAFGVSLGNYIIFSGGGMYNDTNMKHELGHCAQSRMLGWLYLLIVGLPSAVFNLISQHNKKWAKNYYRRYPENQADRLGGVERSKS